MTEFLFTICLLAVVIVGMLVMTQVLSLEGVCQGIWRCLLFLSLVLVVVWTSRAVLLPISICVLVWLKGMALWALLIVLAVIAAMFVLRLLLQRLATKESYSKRQQGRDEL